MKNAAGGKQEKLLGTPRKQPRAGELSAGRGSRAQVGSGHNQIPATRALATSAQSGSPHAETLTESPKKLSQEGPQSATLTIRKVELPLSMPGWL